MSSKLTKVALLGLAVVLSASLALAQGIGGSILGRVIDQSNAGVGGAPVRIVNKATGQVRNASTDTEGRYEARELPPGLYEVTIEQSGFKTVIIENVQVGVGQNARLQTITVEPIPVEERIEVKSAAEVALVDPTTPTLSTSFSEKQIRELPILSRDINNLALLAPGVFSVRSFSFASTLVPFAANGSRGRDNNFIIDSVDNNEPLFGGAAAQFTNTDLFAEYRVLTNQYKAEYGRNSGSVVNIVTERGGNDWRGTLFWFGQHDMFNASTSAQRAAQVEGRATYFENQIGGTLGGPIKEGSSWLFASYQWDRAREDLSGSYPLIATMPTPAGLAALASSVYATEPTVLALLGTPSIQNVGNIHGQSPCGRTTSSLPPTNPCTLGSANTAGIFFGGPIVPVQFGTYLVPRAGLFDVRDHQASIRWDQRLSNRDDFYIRYLFDDLLLPRTGGGIPSEVGFSDIGLYPDFRLLYKQRTQSLGIFWTRAWSRALHELRASYTRISSQTGALDADRSIREGLPALTVIQPNMATTPVPPGTVQGTLNFLNAFTAAGNAFTIGRETRPANVNSNLLQVQDNVSISREKHSIKFGVNLVRTQSNIRHVPGDLGQYFYGGFIPGTSFILPGFEFFTNNFSTFGFRRFPNFFGSGGDVLPLREFAQFYFFQDDIQLRSNFTLSVGLRYENYGQAMNELAERNPLFAVFNGGQFKTDKNNIAPRIGFAWSWTPSTVLRAGYGFFYNPTVFNIPLLAWQSGPISPLVGRFLPPNDLPDLPFFDSNVTEPLDNCDDLNVLLVPTPTSVDWVDCSHQDRINPDLRQPYVQNFTLSLQQQVKKDILFEVSYVASKGTGLFQRANQNPNDGWDLACLTTIGNSAGRFGCLNNRRDTFRGSIAAVTNGASSTYHGLQFSGTKRLSGLKGWGRLAVTAAYTWSHMLDNASEIFGPSVRRIGIQSLGAGGAGSSLEVLPVEVITPFAQNPDNTGSAERGNSSFDRRHRLAVSSIWLLPSPNRGRWLFGDWQVNSFITFQSGQPFSVLNSVRGNCDDSFGDGLFTNDRPDVGNSSAPRGSVALINNTLCIDPRDTALIAAAQANGIFTEILPGGGSYITPVPLSVSMSGFIPINAADARFVQVGRGRLGNAGRNILVGPDTINLDLAVFKNVTWGERWTLQFRAEAYNLFNHANPGSPNGNVFTTNPQPVPGIAFAPGPGSTPARVVGSIPENGIDTTDSVTGDPLFLSQRFLNTSSRRFQFGVKLIF